MWLRMFEEEFDLKTETFSNKADINLLQASFSHFFFLNQSPLYHIVV